MKLNQQILYSLIFLFMFCPPAFAIDPNDYVEAVNDQVSEMVEDPLVVLDQIPVEVTPPSVGIFNDLSDWVGLNPQPEPPSVVASVLSDEALASLDPQPELAVLSSFNGSIQNFVSLNPQPEPPSINVSQFVNSPGLFSSISGSISSSLGAAGSGFNAGLGNSNFNPSSFGIPGN